MGDKIEKQLSLDRHIRRRKNNISLERANKTKKNNNMTDIVTYRVDIAAINKNRTV